MLLSHTLSMLKADELVETIGRYTVEAHTSASNLLVWACVDRPPQPWGSYKRPLKRPDAASPAPRVWRCALVALQHDVMRIGSHSFTEWALSQVRWGGVRRLWAGISFLIPYCCSSVKH